MHKSLPWLILAGVLAGCSNAPSDQAAAAAMSADGPAAAAPSAQRLRTVAARGIGFADLVDRGDLLDYDTSVAPVRRSAYAWHPVAVSEEHALRAVAGGELVVTAPDGRPIRLQYERHVEHPDGNWTWIGREQGAVPGSEAIITFGEKAVFGTIPNQGAAPLRLTTAGGRAWLMETDQRAVALMDNAATRPRRPDFRVPSPDLKSHGGADASFGPGLAAAEAAALAGGSGNVVDLLIGYTSAFATRLGGQSQANTRLTFLVDVTNQAYANSNVAAEVRLVKTMQVTYPDATSNEDALYDLTGVQCTEQPGGGLSCDLVGPPAALQPLHTARDQFGADLVSLVRNFSDPENEGCGIAWINGGGLLGVKQSDEITGMSVVSDSNGTGGPGSFPDNGYICSNETLAHELGHNMGSAHDRDTSDGDDNVLQSNEYGAYAYSFGYKTAPGTGDFFTVMAYGDSGQTGYRVFSNPNITICGGFPCGTAQADNARSLRQTIPVVAGFRATVVPPTVYVRNDVDGNGKSDMLWFHPVNRLLVHWIMDGHQRLGSGAKGVAAGFAPIATGDYNGDGMADVLIANASTLQVWFSTGSTFTPTAFRARPSGWTLAASGDVDGDGKSDLAWFHPATRQFSYWILDGTTLVRSRSFIAGADMTPLTSGDYNGDGRLDIVWRHASGTMQVWLGGGTAFTVMATGNPPAGWESIGSGDVNGDGNDDLLWYRASQNLFAYWLRNGAASIGSGTKSVPATFSPMTHGDYTGDGRLDLTWERGAGAILFWLGYPNDFAPAAGPAYPAGWVQVQ